MKQVRSSKFESVMKQSTDPHTVESRLDYLLALAEDFDDLSIYGLIGDVAKTGQHDMANALRDELERRIPS